MEEKYVLETYKKIKTIKGTAKFLKKDPDFVSRILAKNHITDFIFINKKDKNKIKQMYLDGKNVKNISKKINIGQKKITYFLLSEEIMRKRTPKIEKDETFFYKIDTEEKAYWFGMLCADGYVNYKTESFEISLKDYEHILKFRNCISKETKIQKKKVKLKGYTKTYISYRINISSKKMINDLKNHGCCQKKSLTLKWPIGIPDNLINHFMRGYFDGDGCIYSTNKGRCFSLYSTKEFLEKYISFLPLRKNKIRISQSQIHEIKYIGYKNIIKIKDFLYKDATVYLKRKKEIFDKIENQYIAVLGQIPQKA